MADPEVNPPEVRCCPLQVETDAHRGEESVKIQNQGLNFWTGAMRSVRGISQMTEKHQKMGKKL